MSGGDRIADVLVRQGVRLLFTVCGGHISPILVSAKARGIRVVGVAESRRLNRVYRGQDRPANVLSFDADRREAAAAGLLGDLAICAPVVAREARQQGKALPAHWAHMVVHGTLHLLGYRHDRPRETAVMEAREQAILAALGYGDPYEAH